MRKALIGLIMAATAATPVLAAPASVEGRRGMQAEDRAEARAERRAQRQAERQAAQNRPERTERREDRAERRTERREDRSERRAERRENRRPVVTREPNGVVVQQYPNGPTRYSTREQYRERQEDRREWRQDRREDRREWRQDRREDRRDWRQDRRADRRWDRNWRSDRRYDWQRWRYANRNLYRIGRYYAPYRNYNYNRLSIGFILGAPFYSSNYWISDPWQYRLPPAYPGTRWVRYYDDVLLVDVYTGEVLDVIHDFFW